MSSRSGIIMSRRAQALLTVIAGLLIAAMAPAFAHGGFDHVMGTVVKVENNVLTVKTAKGNVDVKLSDQTELTMDNHKATAADLKAGARVIVEVPKGSKDMRAQSVKIGVVPKVAAPKASKK
jgi:hypothetical protein